MKTAPILTHPTNVYDRVAFAGPMCSGKTFLADHLVGEYNYTKVAFANPLKWVAEFLYGPIVKNNEGRKMLQELSDDLKKWDANLFTTQLLLSVEEYIDRGYSKIVVDDLRYYKEYEVLKANGFLIIGVRCREPKRLERIFELYPDTKPERFFHPSETEWEKMTFDYWIENSDSTGLDNLDGLFPWYA